MALRRVLAPVAVLVTVWAGATQAAAACPKRAAGEDPTLYGLAYPPEFEGTVAGERIRLFVEVDFRGEPSIAQGAIWWAPRSGNVPYGVKGVIDPDCVVTLTDPGSSSGEAEWTLRFEPPARLVGQYRTQDGKRWPVRLRAVAAPSCNGREPWRTFASPDWPVTFDYPASWILVTYQRPELDGRIVCPELSAVSEDYLGAETIELSSGRLDPARPTTDGRLSRRAGDLFFTDGRVWRFGCNVDEELGGDCRETLRATLNGIAVVQGKLRARNGVEYPHTLFLSGEQWFVISSVESLGATAVKTGEIELGDDVMSRVIRSVRPTP